MGLLTNETSARIPGIALSVSTTKPASLMPRSRRPGFCTESVSYNERCTLAASLRDCSIRSCKSAGESDAVTAFRAALALSRILKSFELGAVTKFV